jgi:glycosyltransferase involved in cell wall biosynthesis
MTESVFCYVEFEPFADAGHRVHTANHYADKLRGRDAFNHYRVIAPPARLAVTDLQQALRGYDAVDLSLDEMLTPAVERTNIDAVGRKLADALKVRGASPGDTGVVYSHMPSPFALLALYVGVRTLADETGARPHVLVRLCMIDEEWAWYRLRLSRLISTIQSDPVVGHLFRFTTESRRLSAYYRERCGFDAPMQFNPFPDDELVVTANKHRYHRSLYGNQVQFAYLGEAREEKGFQYLPRLVDALRASGVEFSFLVHAFSNPVNDTEPIRAARDALLRKATERQDLHLVHFAVPDSIYTAHQRRADVVVMPYLHKAYRIRGSGVAFEAIRSNAFILAAEDLDFGITFMDSGRVVEYRPEEVDVARIHEVVAKVHAARGDGWGAAHPAQVYHDCFFEQVVDALLADDRGPTGGEGGERFAELMQRLAGRPPIAALAKSLGEAGFVLT